MQIRRERLPQMGVTNYDKRSSEAKLNFMSARNSKAKLEILSSPKGKEFLEATEKKIIRSSVDFRSEAIGSTRSFYANAGKKWKAHASLSQPRIKHLEPIEKGKMPFTGDSPLALDRHKLREPTFELDLKQLAKEHLVEEKHEINTQAIQETQLVGMDPYTLETLKDKVDLQKVREVKRAIRRRYANHKNLQKIFRRWDADNTGRVSVKNVYDMANELGLKINFDEARVLVASADRRSAQNLTLDEFLDLIYNKDDVMNVNLNKIPVTLSEDLLFQKEEIDKNNLLGYLAEDARKGREAKHENQIKMVLKNRVQDLNNFFYAADPNHTGELGFEKFEQCIKKLGINENILLDKDIKSFFEKHRINQYNSNYRELLKDLRSFRFQYDEVYKHNIDGSPKEKKTHRTSRSEQFIITAKEEKTDIVDIRELPANKIQSYYSRSRKVAKHLKRLFPTKKHFEEFTSQLLAVEPENIKNRAFSKGEVKNLFDSIFSKIDGNLARIDFEGFFSSFLYNQHGYTDLKEMAYTIYDQDEQGFYNRVQNKMKGPSPPKELIECKLSSIPENMSHYAPETERGDVQRQEFSHSRRSSMQMQFEASPAIKKKIFSTLSNGYNTGITRRMLPDTDINPILKRIEDKVFTGTNRAFKIYKSFDVDKDGFLSHQDMVKKLTEMNVIDSKDIPRLLNYMDPDNKGYVSFQEFHKRLRANVTQSDEWGRNTVSTNIIPSKEVNELFANNINYVRERNQEVRDSLRPPAKSVDVPRATRFGASPAWKNTFLLLQPASDSPMFMDEGERFTKDPLARTRFQIEEKAKRMMTDGARVSAISTHSAFYKKKVEDNEAQQELRHQNKLSQKQLVLQTYEHTAHLKNPFF